MRIWQEQVEDSAVPPLVRVPDYTLRVFLVVQKKGGRATESHPSKHHAQHHARS